MKKLILLFGLLSAMAWPLWCSSQLSSTEKEELTKIVNELETLTNEQAKIIEASEKRNEELKNLSKDKQTIIEQQREIIDEQKNLLEKPKTSWQIIINCIVAAIAAFFGGFFTGVILF